MVVDLCMVICIPIVVLRGRRTGKMWHSMQAKRQVEGGNISEVDTIEVRVRGSKGDQG